MDKVCVCGHKADEHSVFSFGCLHDNGCKCNCSQSDVYEQIVYSLETDVIQARRVADERQEIINEHKVVLGKVMDYNNGFLELLNVGMEGTLIAEIERLRDG